MVEAERMHLATGKTSGRSVFDSVIGPVVLSQVPARDKKIRYDVAALPKLDKSKSYSAAEVVTGAMKVFARDERVVSIDSDLASTSGLEAGVGGADQLRALNRRGR